MLPPPVAMHGPAPLPLLGPALRAERLLGFCHGQYGQRRDDDDDEGWGRRLCCRGDPPPWRTHVPLRMPLSAQGRPVFWPRSVRGCETKEREREMHVRMLCHHFLSVCVKRFRKENKWVECQSDWAWHGRASHDSYAPPFVYYPRGTSSLGIMLVYFDKERHVFEGFCVPDCVCRYWIRKEEGDSLSWKDKGLSWRRKRK